MSVPEPHTDTIDGDDERVAPGVAARHRIRVLHLPAGPTVLVDGHDPFSDADTPAGLACRIYRSATGAAGAPSVEDLVTVLDGG